VILELGMIELMATRLMVIPALWMSLAVHEWAHAWAADRLGDDTARLLGRMTLDPTRHVDPVGTLLLPLIGIPFGWAKPVPINPLRFRGVALGTGVCITAAAGPAANLVMALIAVGMHRGLEAAALLDAVPGIRWLLATLVPLNLVLALFNLAPIPPLDGSRIADALVPYRWRDTWARFGAGGPWVLIVIVAGLEILGFGPISALFRWSAALL
jgi:Zn-dependent protease